jgi:hypothetical protein
MNIYDAKQIKLKIKDFNKMDLRHLRFRKHQLAEYQEYLERTQQTTPHVALYRNEMLLIKLWHAKHNNKYIPLNKEEKIELLYLIDNMNMIHLAKLGIYMNSLGNVTDLYNIPSPHIKNMQNKYQELGYVLPPFFKPIQKGDIK